MMANDDALAAVALSKTFGQFVAVDRVTFTIRRGEIFGFLGPNGAGKTTTIRMLLSLIAPTSGSARVLGFDVVHQTSEIRRRIGYMSQRFSLYNDLTVSQNLEFFGGAYGLRAPQLKQRMAAAIEMAGLRGRERQLVQHLAGGWRQRLALGCAILHEPEMLFLDEPTAGVDPISRRSFWDLLYDLSDRGQTILVTTHYMDEAEHCHRLAFIQRGRIVALGAPEEIKRNQLQGQVLEVDCDRPGEVVALLRQESCFQGVSLYGAQIHVLALDHEGAAQRLRALLDERGIVLRTIEAITPTLEDAFIASVSGHEISEQHPHGVGAPSGTE
jgi:ABC-2 type transport system ATP-binding protein